MSVFWTSRDLPKDAEGVASALGLTTPQRDKAAHIEAHLEEPRKPGPMRNGDTLHLKAKCPGCGRITEKKIMVGEGDNK